MSADEEILPASERLKALPDPPTEGIREMARMNRLFVFLASLALSLGLIGFAVAWGGRNEASDRADRNATAAAVAQDTADKAVSQGKAAEGAAKEANRRLAELGKPTVPVPTVSVPPSPPPIVSEGLSGQQLSTVQALIASKLSTYQPVMSPAQVQQVAAVAAGLVPKPADGKTPTAAELQPLIAAAHLAFCANGRCDGKPGPTGSPGPAGANGQPGADAPPVTDDQLRPLIAEKLTAYCAAEGDPCRGLRGERGIQGVQGRSLAGMDCADDGRWRQYWVDPAKPGDQETVYVDGPCRALPPLPSEAAARTTR